MFLDLARGAKLVEGAFRHAWEDVDHGVDSVFLIAFGERNHFDAEGQERPVEKLVH